MPACMLQILGSFVTFIYFILSRADTQHQINLLFTSLLSLRFTPLHNTLPGHGIQSKYRHQLRYSTLTNYSI
ncbi:hypothetical protein J3F84DRAFT_377784 [Trichoderma pleuroticola]